MIQEKHIFHCNVILDVILFMRFNNHIILKYLFSIQGMGEELNMATVGMYLRENV